MLPPAATMFAADAASFNGMMPAAANHLPTAQTGNGNMMIMGADSDHLTAGWSTNTADDMSNYLSAKVPHMVSCSFTFSSNIKLVK